MRPTALSSKPSPLVPNTHAPAAKSTARPSGIRCTVGGEPAAPTDGRAAAGAWLEPAACLVAAPAAACHSNSPAASRDGNDTISTTSAGVAASGGNNSTSNPSDMVEIQPQMRHLACERSACTSRERGTRIPSKSGAR